MRSAYRAKDSHTNILSRLLSIVTSATLLITSLPVYAQPQAPAAPAAKNGDEIDEEKYAKDANTEINVKNADIAAIVRIFSRKTKRNYILDERVKGKVSIYLPGKVSAEESLRILDAVLSLKGFTSVPIGENLWKIVPSKDAKQSTIPTLTEAGQEPPTSAIVTRLVTLKYMSAEEVQQVLQQLISPDGLINAYASTNSLIIIDSEDNIERLVKLVDELDVPSSNRDMSIIPVKHADATEIAEKLNEILGEGSKKEDSASDLLRARLGDPTAYMQPPINAQINNGMPGGVPARASGKTVSAKGREPKIIPDQRTNSIIVVADEDTTARVRALISELDSRVDLSGNKFYVYRCQHANAEELAAVLSGVSGNGSSSSSSSSGSGGGFGNSSNSSMNRSSTSSNSRSTSSKNSGNSLFGDSEGGASSSKSSTGKGGGSAGPSTTSLGENISVTADPATNSLIITASKADYEKLKALLEKLDVKRRQVVVEAMLLEVSIDRSIRLSTDWLASTGGADGGVLARSDFNGNLATLFTDPEKLQGFTIAAASAGTLNLPGGLAIPSQSLLIRAAENNSNVNVLSAPTILATDNEEAQIVVGQNVPFLASTSTNESNLNNTFNQIERQDVGITLRITPQISSQDYVTLKLYTEVSALILATLASSLGPTTTKRQSETTAIAKDGQMVVIGGLISDEVSESDDGVPFLKDIPVLGHAFKSNSQARGQKNLLIFLTPRIIRDQYDGRDLTIERREKLNDVIAHYEVEPQRKDILNNPNIDNVAESSQYEGPKPGTIRGPDKRAAKQAIVEQESNEPIILDGGKPAADGALEFDLDPANTPNNPDVIEVDPGQEQAKASLGEPARLPEPSKHGRYIVLQYQDPADASKALPFAKFSQAGLVGITIPEGSSALEGFFQVGHHVAYNLGKEKAIFQTVGTFSSPSEAQALYSELSGGWYSLSSYELMNLGKGPWQAE